MTVREELKILFIKEKTTITEVARLMAEKTNKPYTMRSLSQKLLRETLRADEYKLIADLLGYDVILKKRDY